MSENNVNSYLWENFTRTGDVTYYLMRKRLLECSGEKNVGDTKR